MSFVGNLLWFVFGGGLLMCFAWLLLGALMCCTIIGIPFGVAAFRIAGFAAFPFGKELVDARMLNEKRIRGTAVANVVWVILAGFWLALGHAVVGVLNMCAFFLVFPIAWGMANFKLAKASFAPLGKRTVPKQIAQVAIQRHAEKYVESKFAS